MHAFVVVLPLLLRTFAFISEKIVLTEKVSLFSEQNCTARCNHVFLLQRRLAADNEQLRVKTTQLEEEAERLQGVVNEQNQSVQDEFKKMIRLVNKKDDNMQKMMQKMTSEAEKTHTTSMLEKDKEIQKTRDQVKNYESQIRSKEKEVEEHLLHGTIMTFFFLLFILQGSQGNEYRFRLIHGLRFNDM